MGSWVCEGRDFGIEWEISRWSQKLYVEDGGVWFGIAQVFLYVARFLVQERIGVVYEIMRPFHSLCFNFHNSHLLNPSTNPFAPPPSQPSWIPKSPHKLQLVVRWPSRLCETETALDALQELSRDLVAHDVRLAFVALVQFLARRALVDAHHGDADGPGSGHG